MFLFCTIGISPGIKKIINVNNTCRRSNINVTVSEHRGVYEADVEIVVKENV